MSAVIIDDEPVLYPKVTTPDIYVIMSQEGFEKYGEAAPREPKCSWIQTLVHSRPACRYIEIPATREARKLLAGRSSQTSSCSVRS